MKTVSYELALKFKEVAEKHGVVLPESAFYWYEPIDFGTPFIAKDMPTSNHLIDIRLHAHTADELMDDLIHEISENSVIYSLVIITADNDESQCYVAMYCDLLNMKNKLCETNDEKFADALCKIKTWLIENGYVK